MLINFNFLLMSSTRQLRVQALLGKTHELFLDKAEQSITELAYKKSQ